MTSYFEFQRYDATLHAIRTRVRRFGAGLVSRWLRVRPPVRAEAHALLLGWRRRAQQLLGVHMRGTDKVTHPKISLERFTRFIDRYLATHPSTLVVLATDDATYCRRALLLTTAGTFYVLKAGTVIKGTTPRCSLSMAPKWCGPRRATPVGTLCATPTSAGTPRAALGYSTRCFWPTATFS